MEIRVSVIIPVWNGESFVARAVRSALDQTIEDIEVLVADNGSTDGTWDVLQSLAAEDPRVRPLRAQHEQGADIARNACLDVARGEWIAPLDADDRMHPRRLERLLAYAEANGAMLVADNQRLVDASGKFLRLAWDPRRFPTQLDAAGYVEVNVFGQRRMQFGYLKPVYRRTLIEESGLRYPHRPRVVEDYHFLYALLRRGTCIYLLPEALYDYVQMPASLSRTFGMQELVDIRIATQAHIDNAGADERLRRALTQRMRSVDAALVHCAAVGALKEGRLRHALGLLLSCRAAVPLMVRSLYEGTTKRFKRLWRKAGVPAVLPACVGYFGQDCTDNAVIRRITALQSAGLDVLAFTFRRQKFNRDYQPTWENVALGETRDRDYRGRLVSLLRAARIIVASRRRLAGLSLFYARNIDMALLAWFGQLVSGSSAPLVYEVLDVQRAFQGERFSAGLLRWVERRVLAHCRLLVVSSPGFIDGYFKPVQKYQGEWALLENKILSAQLTAMEAPRVDISACQAARQEGRWVIGWFGTLRCVESLRILSEIADALPDQVLIYLRGFPTETGLAPFLDVVNAHPNMIYDGEFFSPRDLPALYGAIDFVWGFDFLDAGANSDWLIPNRFYDAGYFAVPLLAAADTQTGAEVERLGAGWTFPFPLAPALIDFLRHISPQQVANCQGRIAALPRSLFCEEEDTRRLIGSLLPLASFSGGMAAATGERDLARISGGIG